MSTEHTPTPWKVERYTTPGQFITETRIRAKDNSCLANVGPCNIEANAAFIVTACNSHDALVEAAKETREILNRLRGLTVPQGWGLYSGDFQRLDNINAKALKLSTEE